MKNTLEAKGIKGNILLVLGSSLVSLCVLEIALRFLTPFPIHGHTNLQPHNLLGYTLSSRLSDVDHNGFRNPPGVSTAIIAIGDSNTQGYNVRSRDSWPAQLSSKIRQPVYNFGVGGYGVHHYGVLLANLPPDVKEIILGLFVANDFNFLPPEGMEGITPLGKNSVERAFGVTVPAYGDYEYRVAYKGIRTRLKEHTAIVSALYYWIDRYYGNDLLKPQVIAKKDPREIIKIDGIPVGVKREIDRHNSITDRSNPKVAERVDFFVELLKRFKELHPDIQLKILLLPSKEGVLHSAELTCPRTIPSGLILKEIELKNYLMKTMVSAGFQVEDALGYILEEYCLSPDRVRNEFYPEFDGHPYVEGYKAFAQAAYVLHNRF